MSISLDRAFGLHAPALLLREERARLLAENLANAETPNYKARDINFGAELARATGGEDPRLLARTRAGHIDAGGGSLGVETLYRQPRQPSLDGNSVETHVERGKFLDNALRYQASLRLLSGRIESLRAALSAG